jgi:hypothetical protein
MRPKKIASLMLLIFLLPAFAKASPDEAGGTVVDVVDGKTFDVRIEKNDSRIREGVERVTLADLEVPNEGAVGSIDGEINELVGSSNGSTSDETSARELAVAILLNKTVWLDIDDKSEGGRNSEGELVTILYLSGLDGQPVVSPSFNRMLVDYRIAELNDSDENEFDPADWWPPKENGSEENVSGEEEAGEKSSGLNIDINPTKPNVNVNITPLNVNINPTKPNVNIDLSPLNVDVNPTKPNVNVSPNKPVIDVHPTQPNVTAENDTSEDVSSDETETDESVLPFANSSEPVIVKNLTAPITLIDPRSSITVINSTGVVTVIDPAQPVKVINSTDLAEVAEIDEMKRDDDRDLHTEAEAAPEPGELTDPQKL